MNSVIRKVLVVDDDEAMRDMVVALLEDAGYTANGAQGADQALEILGDDDFDAVISDIRMPGRSGIELLGEIRELRPETPIIMMTAFGTIDSAVEAMQAGAFDYVTKPFKRDAVLMSLERAFEHSCEVCVTFHGQSACREAAGQTEEAAMRTAVENACAFLASGMTQSVACTGTAPSRWSCTDE